MPVALPGGLTVTVPLAEWRRPDGAAVQRVGIPPQVAAERTLRGVRVGRDEVLERALQWLQQALDGAPGRRRE
jgi:C-terminal processing protease CtpA/Prc